MTQSYPQELVGYTISASGLCEDGRIATYSERFMDAWLERAIVGPWRFLAHIFQHVQTELLHYHSDIDPTKLKWRVDGIYRVKREVYKQNLPPRLPTGPLTAAELAKLP